MHKKQTKDWTNPYREMVSLRKLKTFGILPKGFFMDKEFHLA